MTQPRDTLLQCLPLPLLPDARERLQRHYEVVELWQETDPEAALAQHADAVTIMTTGGAHPAPAELMDRFPRLQAICNWGVGYDAIDVDHAQSRGIQISNTPDVLNDCVADLAWGLLLATARRLGQNERHARSGLWGAAPPCPLGMRVSGKKLGIVGLGRVGAAIAERSLGFGMQVRYHNRRPREDVRWIYEGSLVELASWADFLIIATVGGPSTRHLIGRDVLEALGPQGLLINISRGSVVHQDELVQALVDGRLGGAGLDVYDQEPEIPEALKTLEHVVLLPHIGSASTETRRAMSNLVVENVESWARDGRLLTPIDAQA